MSDTDNTTGANLEPVDTEDVQADEDGGKLPPTSDAPAEDDPDTFPRSYVEELRTENARYRQRAQQADTLAERLHIELVRATGRLADPTDLKFDAEHLDDAEKLTAALDGLLGSKPHLGSRRPAGHIGQGVSGSAATVDLAAILRGRAG